VRCVLAFLKRRWVLLLCAVVLLACNVIFVSWSWCDTTGSGVVGLIDGVLEIRDTDLAGPEKRSNFHLGLARPNNIGRLPTWMFSGWDRCLSIPLWLPLCVVISWIVFREVRWREKMRAKESDLR
jgi:hypothetical protein